MIKNLHCIALYTEDINKSKEFYKSIGLIEAWTIEREMENNKTWTLIGFKSKDGTGSEIVVQDNPSLKEIDIELYTDNVIETYNKLKTNPDINWIVEPKPNEYGHIAVFEAPDKNVFVLVGK